MVEKKFRPLISFERISDIKHGVPTRATGSIGAAADKKKEGDSGSKKGLKPLFFMLILLVIAAIGISKYSEIYWYLMSKYAK
jgi:hypothetical protein